MPQQHKTRARAKRVLIGVSATLVVAIILWLDIATGLWSELVVLSGLAAGLVTFLLTALVLDKILARSTARRWAPVNRLALTEFLYSIADDEHSDISRGEIVPRTLPQVNATAADLGAELHALRKQVVRERALLSKALGTWAQFLASSGDNDQVMRHIADVTLQLHRVRDVTLEVEDPHSGTSINDLNRETQRSNDTMRALEAELRERIRGEDQLAALAG